MHKHVCKYDSFKNLKSQILSPILAQLTWGEFHVNSTNTWFMNESFFWISSMSWFEWFAHESYWSRSWVNIISWSGVEMNNNTNTGLLRSFWVNCFFNCGHNRAFRVKSVLGMLGLCNICADLSGSRIQEYRSLPQNYFSFSSPRWSLSLSLSYCSLGCNAFMPTPKCTETHALASWHKVPNTASVDKRSTVAVTTLSLATTVSHTAVLHASLPPPQHWHTWFIETQREGKRASSPRSITYTSFPVNDSWLGPSMK